jgi:hypothetical protein
VVCEIQKHEADRTSNVSIRADTCGAPHDLLYHPKCLRSSPTLPNQSRETQSIGRIRLKTKFRVILFRSSSVSIPIAPLQAKRCQLSAPDLASATSGAFGSRIPGEERLRADGSNGGGNHEARCPLQARPAAPTPDLQFESPTAPQVPRLPSRTRPATRRRYFDWNYTAPLMHPFVLFVCVLILHFQIHKFCGLLNAWIGKFLS